VGSERVGNEPQVGMERFRRLVVERVKEVDSVLVDLVREVAKETLVDEVLHLLLGHLLGIIVEIYTRSNRPDFGHNQSVDRLIRNII